jgi:type II secretory pathway predicted ATPase ExeA
MEPNKILALYGLKWNPFISEVPKEGLYRDVKFDRFSFLIESLVLDGGFALITGESGLGKSVILRLLFEKLKTLRELTIIEYTRPQSALRDFYDEIGLAFSVDIKHSMRYGGFKGLRQKWQAHFTSTLLHPVLLIDDAQEMPVQVLSEIRILSGANFDSKSLLTAVLVGDHRLTDKLKTQELLPLLTRIKTRLNMTPPSVEELTKLLTFVTTEAGNPDLMTPNLKRTLAEHAMGNYRIMMNLANETLILGAEKEVPKLDIDLFFELHEQLKKKPPKS